MDTPIRTREDEIYDETHAYFDAKKPKVPNIDRLPLIHFRYANTGLDLNEAISILESRKLVDTLQANKENK